MQSAVEWRGGQATYMSDDSYIAETAPAEASLDWGEYQGTFWGARSKGVYIRCLLLRVFSRCVFEGVGIRQVFLLSGYHLTLCVGAGVSLLSAGLPRYQSVRRYVVVEVL